MSHGPRLSRAFAADAAKAACRVWGMTSEAGCRIVGSFRRNTPDVGDLEFVAPLPVDDETDWLYEEIRDGFDAGGLFGDTTPKLAGRIISGVKRGFLLATIELDHIHVGTGEVATVPIQIHRYMPGDKGNRGWIEILRTGPTDHGRWFLAAWSKAMGVPFDRQASMFGYLRDAYGGQVPTPTEEGCYERIKSKFIKPEDRK